MHLPHSTSECQLVLPELAASAPRRGPTPVRRVGRVRLPLALNYRPWATLYRLPDGRLLWCVRLWFRDHAEPRCVGTDTLRRFAAVNDLADVRAEVDALVERACAHAFCVDGT
jgi:hypothetical protein